MNFEKSEVFDNQDLLIKKLINLVKENKYIFRGYNLQEQLLPNIIRNKMEDVEADLLFEFEHYGNQYLNTSNPIDFMSYAQHFGLSTRLLDFTYNPFIALYFALYKQKSHNYRYEDDKEYYYIRYCDFTENILIKHVPIYNQYDRFEINSMAKRCKELFDTIDMMFNPQHQFPSYYPPDGQESIINNFFATIAEKTNISDEIGYVNSNIKKIKDQKLFLFDPNQSNKRLVMQQGLFMLPYDLNKEKHEQILKNNTKVIKIHKNLRDSLLSYLDTVGINAFRLMPDLSSICKSVEYIIKQKRSKRSELFKKK